MYQNAFRELTVLPRPLARFKGAAFRREGMKERERKMIKGWDGEGKGNGMERVKCGGREMRRTEEKRVEFFQPIAKYVAYIVLYTFVEKFANFNKKSTSKKSTGSKRTLYMMTQQTSTALCSACLSSRSA